MQINRIAILFLVAALAAPITPYAKLGDILFVQKDNSPIREGPNKDAPLVLQLNRGHKLIEFERKGGWVNVGIDRSGGKEGWIESPLTGSVSPGGKSVAPPDPRFDQFKAAVEILNANAKQRSGFDFFTNVESLGDGIVELTATNEWLAVPKSGRDGNLNTLFNLWDAAEGTGLPISVRIVDNKGTLRMRQSR